MEAQRFTRILTTAALIAGIAGTFSITRPASATRLFGPILINKCTTFMNPGSYQLTTSVGKSGTCMVIQASNVLLDLGGFSLVGHAGTGRGVVIDHGTTSVRVFNGQIKNWKMGVVDAGTNSQLTKLQLMNNTLQAVTLTGANGSTVTSDRFPGNGSISIFVNLTKSATVTQNTITGSGRYGIWLRASTQFAVANNMVSQSGIAGIFVGCTNAGIKNALTCKRSSAGAITSNRVVYSIHLGIAIDRGNTHIQVHNNRVSTSGKYDLIDANDGCGTDKWNTDVYSTHNQPCAK